MQISIVHYSECRKLDFGHFLFSPDFFLKDKMSCWDILEKKSNKIVSDYFDHIKDTVKQIHKRSICYDLTDGLPKFIDGGFDVSILGSTKKNAKAGDFIISRLRFYLEEMGIVEQRENDQLFSTEFLVFRAKTQILSTHTLFALCMTNNIQTILKRSQYGTEHPRFYDFLLNNLPVPDCLINIDGFIKNIISNAIIIRQKSNFIYNHAQTLLLSELGLTHWQPKHQLTFIKNYSDTKQAGRIDAEYFQPKYEDIINAIKNYSGGWDRLGNLCTLKKCVEVGSDEYIDKGVPFVRVSNITQFEISEEKYISEKLYAEIKKHQPTKGEILFSKDATPGIAHYLDEEPRNMIPSGGILRLKSKTDKVNNEYLTLVLNSVLSQEQIKRDVGGSIILHWRPDQVKETVIPILPKSRQIEIKQKITESFDLRKQSRHLLECAKRAVEIAIEQDEQTAIQWLQNETGEM